MPSSVNVKQTIKENKKTKVQKISAKYLKKKIEAQAKKCFFKKKETCSWFLCQLLFYQK